MGWFASVWERLAILIFRTTNTQNHHTKIKTQDFTLLAT